MTVQPTLQQIAQNAERVLRQQFGQALALGEPQLLKDKTRSLVMRCRVEAAPAPEFPAAVIIKQMGGDLARGFSDWASLAYLAEIPGACEIVPRFLAGDRDKHCFVMADLGGSESLDDILRQPDRRRATSALRTLAWQMARLSSATLTTESAFTAIRNALPGAAGLGRQTEVEQWQAGQTKILEWFAATNCPPPPDFLAALAHIAAVYAAPGPFLSFSHGDPAPSNNHSHGEEMRLVDFEYGGFRHALYDITGWNILCPLPLPCVQAMNEAFQQELARTCPAAVDQAQYREAWAAMCAFRAWAILSWISPAVLQNNRPWVDETWTSRHAVFAALTRLQAAAAGSATLAPAAEAAAQLLIRLRPRWPEFADATDVATQWPALPGV